MTVQSYFLSPRTFYSCLLLPRKDFFPHLAFEIFDRGFGSGEKYDKRVGAINSNALRTISSGIVFFHYCEKRQWNCGWISDILECCFCWWKMLYWGALSIERRHSDDGANEEHVRGGQVLNWGSFRNIQSYNNKQLNIRKLYRGILFWNLSKVSNVVSSDLDWSQLPNMPKFPALWATAGQLSRSRCRKKFWREIFILFKDEFALEPTSLVAKSIREAEAK